MERQKLYICGVVQNKKDKIQKIINTCCPYVDGFVWVDNYSTDGTYELLENNKKEGKIYQQKYLESYEFSNNKWLRSGHIKKGDWCFILDDSCVPNKVFLKRLKEDIFYWNKNKVGAICGDKPWLIKFYSTTFIYGDSTCNVCGIQGYIIELKKISGYRKENFVFSIDAIPQNF